MKIVCFFVFYLMFVNVFAAWLNDVPTVLTQPDNSIINAFRLEGNYPNPFNPSTTISYSLSQSEYVKIQIYNIKGQLVKTLVNEPQKAGKHTIVWNGDNRFSRKVSSGIYLYRLETETTMETRKMLLMK